MLMVKKEGSKIFFITNTKIFILFVFQSESFNQTVDKQTASSPPPLVSSSVSDRHPIVQVVLTAADI